MYRLLQQGKWSFHTTFLRLFAGLPIHLNVLESAFFGIWASWFRLVIETHGRVPIITWRARTLSPKGISARNLTSCSRWTFSSETWTFWWFLSVSLFLRFFGAGENDCPFCLWSHLFSRCSIMTETTWVSFRTLSNCLPLLALSHFPLHADFCHLLTFGFCSSFHYFVPGSEVARPHCLINMTFYYCLQSGVDRWLVISNILFVIHGQHSLKLDRTL